MKYPDTLLYDADEILYKASKVSETSVEFDGVECLHSDDEALWRIIHEAIDHAKARTKCSKVHLAFSDRFGNFRKQVLGSYKEHRKATRKPCGYWDAKDRMASHWVSIEYPDLEADDVMGIHHADYACIVSSDKDLKTIPTAIFSPYHDALYAITPENADWNFLFQTLTGDSVDGFKGCPRVGKVKAAKILNSVCPIEGFLEGSAFPRAWELVVEAYEGQKLTEDDAIQQARCARILRPGEWCPIEGVLLWKP